MRTLQYSTPADYSSNRYDKIFIMQFNYSNLDFTQFATAPAIEGFMMEHAVAVFTVRLKPVMQVNEAGQLVF